MVYLGSLRIIYYIIAGQLMQRPVLSMNFYEPTEENHLNPFAAMVTRAIRDKQQQEQARENAISSAFVGLNEAVQHFFPEPAKESPPIPLHRPQSGPYTYDKEYFQHLQNNLKLINAHLEQLEKQV